MAQEEVLELPARHFPPEQAERTVNVDRSIHGQHQISWSDFQDHETEGTLCAIGAELEARLPGACLFEKEFVTHLANSQVTVMEDGKEIARNLLWVAANNLEFIASRIGITFRVYDIYWMWKFCGQYIDRMMTTPPEDFDHYYNVVEIASGLNIPDIRSRILRPDIMFLKNLFIEYYVGSQRGEVEMRLLQMAKSGNVRAIELYRSGFNPRRSIQRREVRQLHAVEDVGRMQEDELRQYVEHLRKKVGECSPTESPIQTEEEPEEDGG